MGEIMQQPFGTIPVHLPKERHQLDEDGVIWIRKRFPTRIGLKFANQPPGIDAVLPAFIAGWRIKSDGIDLPFSEAEANELPIDMLEAINEHIGAPLGSAPNANGSLNRSGEAPPQSEPGART